MNWEDHYYYDETSPSCLRWARAAAGGKVKVGDIAGTFHYKHKQKEEGKGYYRVYCVNKSYAVHRIIWELHNDIIPDGMFIDHISGDSANNRINNLRLVSNRINCLNQSKRNTNKSGVTGVHLTDNGQGRYYWVAAWQSQDGKRTGRMFSVDKHGYDEAFKMACKAREDAIKSLAEVGIVATERHGK